MDGRGFIFVFVMSVDLNLLNIFSAAVLSDLLDRLGQT